MIKKPSKEPLIYGSRKVLISIALFFIPHKPEEFIVDPLVDTDSTIFILDKLDKARILIANFYSMENLVRRHIIGEHVSLPFNRPMSVFSGDADMRIDSAIYYGTNLENKFLRLALPAFLVNIGLDHLRRWQNLVTLDT